LEGREALCSLSRRRERVGVRVGSATARNAS
jgi:hypothetical protein